MPGYARLIDRITDRAHIIETGAESYRFRRTLEKRKGRTLMANLTSAVQQAAEKKATKRHLWWSALVTLIAQGA
jgi:hypothetical protein